MEIFLLMTTLFAMFGAYLNSIGKWEGFLIWILTNAVFAIHNYWIGQWQLSMLFIYYFIISIFGIWNVYKNKGSEFT